MRNLLIFLGFLFFTSCGSETEKRYDCGIKGENCPSKDDQGNSENTDTSTIIYVPVPGPAGKDGANGKDGLDGTSGASGSNGIGCSVSTVSNGALITCGENTVVVLNGKDGLDGTDGQNGAAGRDGVDGHNGTNGSNGTNGQDAPQSAYAVVSVIDPCGTSSGFNEILLKLANGQIIAHYSQGNKEFLSFIGPGSYVTTDFSPCYFTVHADMSITY